MQQHLRDFFVSRICAGYLRYSKKDTILRVYPASADVLYESNYEYMDAYNMALDNDIPNEDKIVYSLIDAGLWTEKNQKDLDTLPERIDDLKVGLLNYAFRPVEREKLRKILHECKAEYNRLFNIRHSWDYMTCEGTASLVKWQYIIEHSTMHPDRSKYDWLDHNVMDVLSYYQENTLPDSVIRELARNEPWGSIWSIRKKNGHIFDDPMSYEQRCLMMWSITYDVVHESPECPQDEIIEDDDMLDGWFVVQKRKRINEKSKDYASGLLTNKKIADSDEIFIVARSPDEIKHIDALNDVRGNIIKKQRMNQVAKKGEVPFIMFTDTQERIRTEFTQRESAHHKGRK